MYYQACWLFNIARQGILRRPGLKSWDTIITKFGQFVSFADMDIIAGSFGKVAELETRLNPQKPPLYAPKMPLKAPRNTVELPETP